MMTSNLFSALIINTNSRGGKHRLKITTRLVESFAHGCCFWLRLLPGRHSFGPQNHEVNEVLGKKQIESPIEGHAHLLFEPGQLTEINRPPEEPSRET